MRTSRTTRARLSRVRSKLRKVLKGLLMRRGLVVVGREAVLVVVEVGWVMVGS